MPHEQSVPHPSSEIRRRNVSKNPPKVQDDSGTDKTAASTKTLRPKPTGPSSFSSFIALGLILALSMAIMPVLYIWGQHRIHTLTTMPPTPDHPYDFENAMRHIRILGAKPKWPTSQALQHALLYLIDELHSLRSHAQQHGFELEVELFRSDYGSFFVDIAHIDLYASYDNVSSVVARLRPANLPVDTPEKALLLAAHLDSAFSSPGANDNVVGVAVILEVLRSIASSDRYALSRPIVVLFNGAEESILMGAHSFVTQHRWAPTIAAHVNMESIGSGDRYHLFRLGPHSPWLVDAYANAVSFPVGTVSATDVFDLKVIPAETDFRAFSEFGNIPGFDFALVDNGYIYHTVQDSVEHVVPSSVHHGGRTVFELAVELAGQNDAIGKHLHKSRDTTQSPLQRLNAAMMKILAGIGFVEDPDRPLSVFFDVLHLKTVSYHEGIAMLLNISVIAATIFVWMSKFSTMGKAGVISSLRMCFVFVACFLCSIASATFASLVYTEVYRARLLWHGSVAKACMIFGPPAFFGLVSAMLLLLPRRLSADRYDHMLFACAVFYMAVTLFLMAHRAMTSYMPTFLLFVATMCALGGRNSSPVLRHFVLSTSSGLISGMTVSSALSTILPLLSRARSEIVPHDTIAAVLVSYFGFVHVFVPCLPILCHFANVLRPLRMALFFITVGSAGWMLAFSNFSETSAVQGVYSTEAPKRLFAIHFHAPQYDSKSILFLGATDPISFDKERLTSSMEVRGIPFEPSSVDLPTWGTLNSTAVESLRPYLKFVTEIALFETETPPDLPTPKVDLTSEEETADGWNVTFAVHGRDAHQLTIRFPVGPDASILAWSLDARMKETEGGVWIRHVGSESFEFWVVQRRNEGSKLRPKFRAAVTTCRLGYSRSSEVMKKLNFETWESPSAVSSIGVEVEL
eukprot:GFKZ01008339.1.p1 GENE.GFKZ01008339.1~~GFKZ01008339.1.p1  ORF type:complete len:915 (+),score=96.89 GFKZ01008339.1:302-3046(+)